MKGAVGKIVRNGVSLHHATMGKGRNIVLIHGLGANHGFWGPRLLLPLARRYRVILVDLRGHGLSSMPKLGYRVSDFAEDVLCQLEKLKVQQADFVGHSFGGMVALQCAVMAPERVRSIFLADTRVRSLEQTDTEDSRPESEIITRRLKEAGLVIPSGEREAGLWLLEQFASPKVEKTREQLQQSEPFIPFSTREGGNKSAKRWLELLENTSLREEIVRLDEPNRESLTSVRQPTMAMYGESALTRESLQGLKASLPHFCSVILPGAGHFFPLTHADVFLQTLMGFLDSLRELRKEERLLMQFTVQVAQDGESLFLGRTLNVSPGGLLLEGNTRLAMAGKLELRPLSHHGEPLQPLFGRVVRIDEDVVKESYRFGISLLPTSEDWTWQTGFTRLRDIEPDNSADPGRNTLRL